MTHGVRIAGGIIALLGGGILLAAVLIHIPVIISPSLVSDQLTRWFFNLIMAVLPIIGGILALTGKRAGGVLSIIAATILIIFGIIAYRWSITTIMPYTFLQDIEKYITGWYSWILFPGLTYETLIITAGSIMILVSPTEEKYPNY